MTTALETLRRIRHTLIPLTFKYGRRFRRVFKFLMEHQHTGRYELEDYQWRKLKELIDYAYEHVPFYRRRFDSIGLHPCEIKNRDHFRQIPILFREEVDNHLEELKSDQFEKLTPIAAVTSGTTRDRMKFYRSGETELWRLAMVWRHCFNIGYRFREPRVELVCPLPFLKDERQMPIDYNENTLLIDPTSISREHCPAIHKRLREFKPKMILCHPGTATSLVEHFRDVGLPPLPTPLICCVGEKIYPDFRDAITSFFQGRLIEYYANRENTVAATELLDGKMYIQSDYCFMEFLNDEGKPVNDEQADIISTSLINFAFPLIRYQTDDVGTYRGYPDGETSGFPVMEIVGGRGKDLLLTRQGLRSTYLPKYFRKYDFDRYKRVQLVQLSLDELILKVIPSPDYRGDEDNRLLEQACREDLGSEFSVRVELVDNIAQTESCKNKMVISQPAVDHLRQRRQSQPKRDDTRS